MSDKSATIVEAVIHAQALLRAHNVELTEIHITESNARVLRNELLSHRADYTVPSTLAGIRVVTYPDPS